MIRVVLPAHLRNLAGVAGEVELEVREPVTLATALDALEARHPVLRGTIRDAASGKRRALVRFFACGADLSHQPPETALPASVAAVLRARLLDMKIQEQENKRAEERKSQVGTGDRSGRIRTYNFPQNRVTDHRIGLTLYKLDSVMQGGIREMIERLTTYYQTQALQNAESVAAH